MKILSATNQTQGQRASDFSWCTEGELVTCVTVICDGDREEGPDGGCGCGRSFSGLTSHKATTTAIVVDLDSYGLGGYDFEDVLEAVRTSRQRAGWPEVYGDDEGKLAEAEAALIAELAASHPAGTILERRLDTIQARNPGAPAGMSKCEREDWCDAAATRTYVRTDWPRYDPGDERAGVPFETVRTCDEHPMGDGQDGAPDYGWKRSS